jgi:gelsolin
MGKKDKKDKKSKDDKKKEKEAKKKLSKDDKKKIKQDKKTKKTESKSQVANFARVATATPSNDMVTKIKANEVAQKAAAQGTPAKTAAEEWAAAGKAAGLQIWRIENFAIQPWPKAQYGKFYNGDSYIVLNTFKQGNSFKWDVHFWLGEKTSQDEAGTAAYKTVELDDQLGGAAVQHREVQDFESDLFINYFKPTIQILQGGIESGFNHVKPAEYEPRLLQLKGKRLVRVSQVSLCSDSLNSGDVFVLDGGLGVFQWNGSKSSVQERNKGGEVARGIRDERPGAKVTVIDEGHEDAHFWELLGGAGPIASAEEGGDDWAAEKESGHAKALFRLSDATGALQMTEVAKGKVTKNLFQSSDVFIFDSGYEIFAWIGKGASKQESTKALSYAQDYLAKAGRPAFLPVTRVIEGGENESFVAALDK